MHTRQITASNRRRSKEVALLGYPLLDGSFPPCLPDKIIILISHHMGSKTTPFHTTSQKSQCKKRLCATRLITNTTHSCCRSCGWHSSIPASPRCRASGFPGTILSRHSLGPDTTESHAGAAKAPAQRGNLLCSLHTTTVAWCFQQRHSR